MSNRECPISKEEEARTLTSKLDIPCWTFDILRTALFAGAELPERSVGFLRNLRRGVRLQGLQGGDDDGRVGVHGAKAADAAGSNGGGSVFLGRLHERVHHLGMLPPIHRGQV